jgi:hypothetical protein
MEISVILLLLPAFSRYHVQHYAIALMAILNEELHAQIRVNYQKLKKKLLKNGLPRICSPAFYGARNGECSPREARNHPGIFGRRKMGI